LNLSISAPEQLPMPITLFHQIGGWHVDHAFLASAGHLEVVVGAGDATGHERWREFQHHVPAHGYDVSFHAELTSTTGPGSK
jgi:hypothetical protein